jgi:hypothetical protein
MNSVLRPLPRLLALALAALLVGAQYAGASGLGWVLNGNVINAETCVPIIGANVSSPYNSYAFNITNRYGNYSLVLGTGNWSVTVTANGFSGGSYLTPYVTNGALFHTFALVPIAGIPGNCLATAKNTTIINTTKTTVTPGVAPNVITVPTSTINQTQAAPTNQTQAGNGEAATLAAVIVVVVIVVAIAAYLAMKKRPENEEKHDGKRTKAGAAK